MLGRASVLNLIVELEDSENEDYYGKVGVLKLNDQEIWRTGMLTYGNELQDAVEQVVSKFRRLMALYD